MTIFVLGSSGVGKTPFVSQFTQALPHFSSVSAGKWARDSFPKKLQDFPNREAFTRELTRSAQERLRENPNLAIDSIRGKLGPNTILEGIRSPRDFAILFDPRTDSVIELFYSHSSEGTLFEKGLEVISSYLEWLTSTGLFSSKRRFRYEYEYFYSKDVPSDHVADVGTVTYQLMHSSLDAVIAQAIAAFSDHAAGGDVVASTDTVHADVPLLRTSVRAEFLYDMDPSYIGELVPCTIFAVSSYKGSVPTFKVLFDDGSVYSYLPPSAFGFVASQDLSLSDLVYHPCRDGSVSVKRFAALEGRVHAFFKKRNAWRGGTYLWTLDWVDNNDLLHALQLETGEIAMLPNHKVKFEAIDEGRREFPNFKKCRQTFTVEDPNEQ